MDRKFVNFLKNLSIISDRRLHNTKAFTIVEILVVIVIIGILAMITIVSYSGIASRAGEMLMKSDLSNAKKILSLYQIENGTYPTSMNGGCPVLPKADERHCLKSSNGASFNYYGNSKYFTLTASKGNLVSFVTNNTAPKIVSLPQPSSCPSGFIPVPGSATYGTSGFCIMKYEAKDGGGGVPVSTAGGSPWINISQTTAKTNSANVSGCAGCHLITEMEWLTVAQNVLSVPSNWSGGAVGSGYIFSGHNDNSPSSALPADSNDSIGYSGTLNSSGDSTVTTGMVGNSQRRTLTLTNGEVIWDLSGNVNEWTDGLTEDNAISQPGVLGGGYAWREFPSLSFMGVLSFNVFPSGTGFSGSDGWTSVNGVGRTYSNADLTVRHGILRGGHWYRASDAGVLCLNLSNDAGHQSTTLGFRVAR